MDYVNLFTGSATVIESLRTAMNDDADILKISGSAVGTMYAITFRSKIKAKAQYYTDAFTWAFVDLGYPRATFVQLETGTESTGLSSLIGDLSVMTDTVSTSLLKTALPYLVGGVALYAVFTFWLRRR